MSRPRPRPVAEASTFGDALETLAPLLEQLQAFEVVCRILTVVFRYRKEIEHVLTEHPRLRVDAARREAVQREWQTARTEILEAVMALEQRGVVVKLPPSITGVR